jgi:thioredoxin reductase
MSRQHDVIICGGGPAGLAAALWLGRYRRKALLVDKGEQRNLSSSAAHGYLTRDGVTPLEFLDEARAELEPYDTVTTIYGTADSARGRQGNFTVAIEGQEHQAKRVILATGVKDVLPDLPGFNSLYGTSLFHCPCCDGYEACGEDVLAIGWGEHVSGYALDLLEWGARVTVVTDGQPFEGNDAYSLALQHHNIDVVEEEVVDFRTEGDAMTGAVLRSGRVLDATKAFFSIAHEPRTGLARELGCDLDELGYIKTDKQGQTTQEGVYAVGDVTPGEQMVQVAAGKGSIAGIACAQSLRGETPAPGAPDPGPDPETELERAERLSAD